MKKKSRHPRSSEASRKTSRTQTSVTVNEGKRPPGNRGRPRKTGSVTADSFYHENTATHTTSNSDLSVTDTKKHTESKAKSSGEWLGTSVHLWRLLIKNVTLKNDSACQVLVLCGRVSPKVSIFFLIWFYLKAF